MAGRSTGGRSKTGLPPVGTAHKVPKVTHSEPMRKASESESALDPRFRKNYRRRIQEADDEGYRWQIPTHSSSPGRPRTTEAGYNAAERTMRVVFRDGTPYEYYGVEPVIWQRFKRSASPGRFINRVLNQYPYARADFEPPGR